MKGTPAIYLGRIVEKKNFRAFIFGANGERRLVESWEEFEANMQSGIWFATAEDAQASKVIVDVAEEVVKPKPKPRARPKPKAKAEPEKDVEVEDQDQEDVLPDDETVFEVTDDFLPQEGE